MSWRRWPRTVAALVALLCALGFSLVYVLSDRTAVGQRADERLFVLLFSLVPGGLPVEALTWLAREVVIAALAVGVTGLAAVAMWRRRWGRTFMATFVTAVSVVGTLWLRDDILTRLRFTDETFPLNSMPSTHASATGALVVSVLLLWPTRQPWWLPNAAGVLLFLVALGNILSQAHRPSDVAGSYLLVAGVAALTCAMFGAVNKRSER